MESDGVHKETPAPPPPLDRLCDSSAVDQHEPAMREEAEPDVVRSIGMSTQPAIGHAQATATLHVSTEGWTMVQSPSHAPSSIPLGSMQQAEVDAGASPTANETQSTNDPAFTCSDSSTPGHDDGSPTQPPAAEPDMLKHTEVQHKDMTTIGNVNTAGNSQPSLLTHAAAGARQLLVSVNPFGVLTHFMPGESQAAQPRSHPLSGDDGQGAKAGSVPGCSCKRCQASAEENDRLREALTQLQAKAHEREQRLQEQVEARDSQIQAQDEQISVARQAASKLEREIKRLKKGAAAGPSNAGAASEPTSTTQPPAAHAWSDLGFGSTEQKETLAMLQLNMEQLVSHIIAHLDEPDTVVGKQWWHVLKEYLRQPLNHFVGLLPGGLTGFTYLLHHNLLHLLLDSTQELMGRSSMLSQHPPARKFSAPGAQVMVEAGEQHWWQAQNRAWFMTATTLREGRRPGGSEDRHMLALAEQSVGTALRRLGCTRQQEADIKDIAVACALSTAATWLLLSCGQVGAPNTQLMYANPKQPVDPSCMDVISTIPYRSRYVAYMLQPGLAYKAPTGELVYLVKPKVVAYEPPAPQPQPHPQRSLFSTTASGQVCITETGEGKRGEHVEGPSARHQGGRGAQEPAGPVPESCTTAGDTTTDATSVTAADTCATADTTGCSDTASAGPAAIAQRQPSGCAPGSSAPAAGTVSYAQIAANGGGGKRPAQSARPRTPAGAQGAAAAQGTAGTEGCQADDMDVDAH